MPTQEELEKARLQQVEKPQQHGQYTNLEGISDNSKNSLNYYGQGWQPSQTVKSAQDYLQSVIDRRPGEFQSNYTSQIKSLYDQIMNRPKFSYDVNRDPLFQQYKNQYVVNGQRAMQDTVGNAAALTGGYGSSWGNTAGYQAYQAYLQQLNGMVPEMEQRAFDRYSQEGDTLRNNLSLTSSLDNMDYNRYRDTVGDWEGDRDYAWGAYNTEAERDRANWNNMLDYYTTMANMENQNYWNRQNFDFQLRQYEDALAAAQGGGSGGTTSKKKLEAAANNAATGMVAGALAYGEGAAKAKADAAKGNLSEDTGAVSGAEKRAQDAAQIERANPLTFYANYQDALNRANNLIRTQTAAAPTTVNGFQMNNAQQGAAFKKIMEEAFK